MSTYQPNVNPSSPEGQALQASIQKQLALLDWSTEEDATMAEYCLVMLGNRKTAGKYLSCFSQNLPTHSLSLLPSPSEQISGELSDLIGGDFDPSFVTWLFDEVKNHYPEPASTPSAQPSTSSSSSSAPSAGLPARPTQPGRMFGAAVSGVKRDSREMSEGGREQPPHQRQRFDRDGAPSGPRNNGGNGGGKSLFDRMGGAKNAQFAPGARNNAPLINSLGMPQAAFDAITQTIQAVNSGAHPSTLATIPFPALAAHPLSSTLPPPVLAQAQAHAMAQAQAFAQMQNVWNSSAAGGFGPAQSGFNPQAAPFHPAFGQMQPPPQNGGFRGQPQAQQFQAPPQQQQRPKPPVVLPKKPELEAICKHGVECTKPTCGFSHPSPVATKESGLVLSSEACDKQLSCQDLDCPKSHVSPSQKNASSSSSSTIAASAPLSSSSVSAPAPPVTSSAADPTSIPGAGTKPCKFGSSCTRTGCVFMHPWDVRGDPNGGTVPCRYGSACTRSDCHFSHPPKHAQQQQYQRSKFSATFNSSSSSSSASPKPSTSTNPKATIGDWPKENPTHVSERLKRFAVNGDNEGGGEKIIPGQQNGNGGGNEKEDKVEIHLDDDQDEKEKDKGGVASSPVKETVTASTTTA
ncbi:hypothetical protein JCM5353_003476 [Sporobolomyces roseus]